MKNTAFLPLILVISSTYLIADDLIIQEQESDNTYTTRTAVMAISEKNVHRTLGGKNPSHLRSKGPFVTADFLYWKADFDGLEIATENQQNSSLSSFKMSDVDFHGEWRPGFRVGLGWLFGEQDQWDLYANWTFFYDKATASEYSKEFLQLNYIPSWSNILGPSASIVSGNWNLHFNMIDLEIGRNYFISRKIALRPHVGLRGGWIDLHYHAKYRGAWGFTTIPSGNIGFTSRDTSFDAKDLFKGIGVRGGADFLWHFSDHFGISSQISGSLLYGSFNVDETFNGGQPALVSTTKGLAAVINSFKVKYSKDFNRVRANIDAFLGLFFETGISNNKYNFAMHAGYELSEWFQQNQLVAVDYIKEDSILDVSSSIPTSITTEASNDFIFSSKDGNLGVQGLTVKFLFNF